MNYFKKSNQLSLTLGVVALVGSFFVNVAFAEIAVIANNATTATSLTAKQVRGIFLKKKTKYPDGSAAVPGAQSEGRAISDEFGKKVLKKKPNQLSAYWSKRVFSGKGVPPEKVGDDAAMVDWVAKTPGGIGYVDSKVVNESVKVLLKVQ